MTTPATRSRQNTSADRAGLSRPTIVRVERADEVTTTRLARIANVLGLTAKA